MMFNSLPSSIEKTYFPPAADPQAIACHGLEAHFAWNLMHIDKWNVLHMRRRARLERSGIKEIV